MAKRAIISLLVVCLASILDRGATGKPKKECYECNMALLTKDSVEYKTCLRPDTSPEVEVEKIKRECPQGCAIIRNLLPPGDFQRQCANKQNGCSTPKGAVGQWQCCNRTKCNGKEFDPNYVNLVIAGISFGGLSVLSAAVKIILSCCECNSGYDDGQHHSRRSSRPPLPLPPPPPRKKGCCCCCGKNNDLEDWYRDTVPYVYGGAGSMHQGNKKGCCCCCGKKGTHNDYASYAMSHVSRHSGKIKSHASSVKSAKSVKSIISKVADMAI